MAESSNALWLEYGEKTFIFPLKTYQLGVNVDGLSKPLWLSTSWHLKHENPWLDACEIWQKVKFDHSTIDMIIKCKVAVFVPN